MPRARRPSSRFDLGPSSGTLLEVCAVCPPGSQGPLGGPQLRPIGTALVNPDRTITAWLAAHPHSGTLLLRPCASAALLALEPQPDAGGLASAVPAGHAAS